MIVYRYISLEYLDSLEKNKLWVSLPEAFNDPFDCDHLIKIDMSHSAMVDAVSAIGACDASALLNYPDETREIVEDAKDYLISRFRNIGVCCFSTCWDSVCMWSHYADKHQGICLAYNADDLIGMTGFTFKPVEYEISPPITHLKDMGHDSSSAILRYVLTKKKEWYYEKEFRLIHYERGGRLIDSPMSLHSVIFGVRTSLEDEVKIRALLKPENSFFRVKRKEGSFALVKEKC